MDNESLINGYLEGTLTPEEKLLFDTLIETDPSFADAVRFEEKTKIAITLESRNELKSKLQLLEKNSKKNNSKSWIFIAASAIILLGISLFYINQTPSTDTLFADYFEPYPNVESPIVRGGSSKTVKEEAFATYELGDYPKASEMFSELSKITDEQYAPFYNAVSLMMINKIEDASSIFTNISWNKEFQGKADWYQSLCQIKLHQLEEAKSTLKKIIKNNSYNDVKAKNLFEILE